MYSRQNQPLNNGLVNFWRNFLKLPLRVIYVLLRGLPYFRFIKETRNTQTPIDFLTWYRQFIKGHNRECYWPVHFTSIVNGVHNIRIGIETSPGLMPGCYIQGFGKIEIGDYTQIACNVGIISGNHVLGDNRKHVIKEVIIGKYCWLGMNSVILPGVKLGDFTIVGAGSIVTSSFPDGYCVIAGNPARVIKKIDPAECVRHRSEYEYVGYIKAGQFEDFSKKNRLFE